MKQENKNKVIRKELTNELFVKSYTLRACSPTSYGKVECTCCGEKVGYVTAYESESNPDEYLCDRCEKELRIHYKNSK